MKTSYMIIVLAFFMTVKGFSQLPVSASNAAEAVGRNITIVDKCIDFRYDPQQKSWLFVINNEDFDGAPNITVVIKGRKKKSYLNSLKTLKGQWIRVDGTLKKHKGKLVIDGDDKLTKIRPVENARPIPHPAPPDPRPAEN